MLATWAAKAVEAATGMPLRIERIRGLVPFDFTVDTLVLGGQEDPWLRVQGASLQWFPESLLRGKLRIGHVQADEVSLLRRPSLPREKPDARTGEAIQPPSLPSVFLERFSVRRLTVDPSVFGEAAEFSASGRMALSGKGGTIQGHFQVQRLDIPKERASVRWVLETDPESLKLDLHMVEPEDGMLSRLAGVRPGTSRLLVSGQGPPDDWQGRIQAESAAWGEIHSEVRIRAARDQLALEARGDLRLREALVPKEMNSLLDHGTCRYALSGALDSDGVVTLDRLTLTAAGAEALLSGRVETARASGELLADLAVPDLGALGVPGLRRPAGSLKARVRFQGHTGAPRIDVDLEIEDLETRGVKAASATGAFRLRTQEGAPFPHVEGLRVQGEGALRDAVFRFADRTFQRQRTEWEVDMQIPSRDTLSFSRLSVSDGNMGVRFSGQVRPFRQSLDGRLHLAVADLDQAPFLEKGDFQGRGSAVASVQADGFNRSVFVNVKGRLEGIGPVPAALRSILGQGGNFEGRVSLLEGREVRVSGFRLALPGAECRMEGSLDLLDKTVQASFQGTFPEASRFSDAAGRTIGGRIGWKAEVRGPVQDPEADLEVMLTNPSVGTFHAQEVRALFQAHRLGPNPEARVSLEILRDGVDLSARADAVLDLPFLRLEGLKIEGAGAHMTGGLTVHVPTGTAQGDVTGSVQDLAAIAGLWGGNLSGRAGFSLRLAREKGAQNALVDLRVEALESPFGTAGRVQLQGSLQNAFNEVSVDATTRVDAFRHGNVRLATMELNTRGGMGDLEFALNGTGSAGKHFRVSAAGGFRWSGKETTLELETFEGAFDSRELKLAKPTVMRHDPKSGFQVAPVLLEVGPGFLEVTGRVGDRMSVQTDFEKIPLSLLALAGGPPMAGEADGRLRLSGTLQEPGAEAEVTVKGARLTDLSWKHLPEIDLVTEASFQDGRLVVHMTADEGGSRLVQAGLTVPLRASIAPFFIDLSKHGSLEGRVAANLDLAPLPGWVALEGQRISGRLEADLSIAGTAADPLFIGEVKVHEGAYELLHTGSVFRDVDVLVLVNGKEVTLEHARATDGNSGRIEVEGVCQPLPDQGFPFNGRLTMKDFQLVRLDDIFAKTGADLKISGTVSEADLAGTVKVVSAEVHIPERLPPKIRELDVVEVKGGSEAPVEKGSPGTHSAKGPEISLDLDVQVPGRTFVRGRGLDSEWKGLLRVTGTAARPGVAGDLSIVRGHYDFFGERFALSSGKLFFDGSHPPDPWMDVTAERRRGDMIGRVTLSGTPSTLRVRVSSEPPLPQDEVMARLLFGRSLTSITPVQALKLARATDAMAGGDTFGFLDRAQQAVRLDQVEVTQSDGGESTALSVGKYVGDGAYVEVEKGIGSDDGKVSVEYEVTPKITVETEVGADAAGGVEVKWKWDY
jgi:translocation and assembly module TamB